MNYFILILPFISMIFFNAVESSGPPLHRPAYLWAARTANSDAEDGIVLHYGSAIGVRLGGVFYPLESVGLIVPGSQSRRYHDPSVPVVLQDDDLVYRQGKPVGRVHGKKIYDIRPNDEEESTSSSRPSSPSNSNSSTEPSQPKILKLVERDLVIRSGGPLALYENNTLRRFRLPLDGYTRPRP